MTTVLMSGEPLLSAAAVRRQPGPPEAGFALVRVARPEGFEPPTCCSVVKCSVRGATGAGRTSVQARRGGALVASHPARVLGPRACYRAARGVQGGAATVAGMNEVRISVT